jgi:hypothetical protein
VNTIHSSSLAFYPVGYNKPQTRSADNTRIEEIAPGTNATGKERQNSSSPKTSSITQIEAALTDNALTTINYSNQPTHIRTLKALTAYTETHNQQAQLRVAEIISGIDLYA